MIQHTGRASTPFAILALDGQGGGELSRMVDTNAIVDLCI